MWNSEILIINEKKNNIYSSKSINLYSNSIDPQINLNDISLHYKQSISCS